MSVWLQEVLEHGGFDIIENPEDAKWLLSQRDEFESLCGRAEECIDDYDEYEEYVEDYDGDGEPQSWQEWRAAKYYNQTKGQ